MTGRDSRRMAFAALLALGAGLMPAHSGNAQTTKPPGAGTDAPPGAQPAAPTAISGEFHHTRDADRFTTTRLGAGYLPSYRSPFDHWGVAIANDHYSQSGWSRDGQRVLARVRRQDPSTAAGLNADFGAARVAGHTTLVADATWSMRLGASTGLELIGARDWVDTQRAIEDGIAYSFAGAALDQQFGERFTAIALAGRQRFSDGNSRNHLRARLIYALVPEHGVSLQLRHRRYTTDDITVPRRYFNPERYEETQLVLALRKRTAWPAPGWMINAALGGGQETIARTDHKPTVNADLRLEGPLENGWRLGLRAQYLRSSGGVEGADYWYSLAGVTLTIPLR